MRSARGFTLIELLVVISIIGIMTTLTFVNFKSFAQDQQLNKAIGEIQTHLRLAQANATTSTICGVNGGAKWIVSFRDDKNIDLFCGTAPTPVRTLTLQNVTINSITSSCGTLISPTVTYSPLLGVPAIADTDGSETHQNCLASVQIITINLMNPKNNALKGFKISAGGAIDAQ